MDPDALRLAYQQRSQPTSEITSVSLFASLDASSLTTKDDIGLSLDPTVPNTVENHVRHLVVVPWQCND